MVFGVHVDTGLDFAPTPYQKSAAAPEQAFPARDVSHNSGHSVFHHFDLHPHGAPYRIDCAAHPLFHLPGGGGTAVPVAGHMGKKLLYQEVP